MLHRLFIAINLPETAKKELLSYKEKYQDLPARWTLPKNLHLTLVFYGNAAEKELEEIKAKVKGIVKHCKPFSFTLSKIIYGPSNEEPKMIWAVGDMPQELLTLQKDLVKALLRGSASKLEAEPLDFTLHITLARLKELTFKRMEPEERPIIDEDISLDIPVHSIEIMESKLKRSGTEYTICGSISLE